VTYAYSGSPRVFVSSCKTYNRHAVTAEVASSSLVVPASFSTTYRDQRRFPHNNPQQSCMTGCSGAHDQVGHGEQTSPCAIVVPAKPPLLPNRQAGVPGTPARSRIHFPVGKDLAKDLFFPTKPASKEVIFVQSTCEATPDLGCPGSAPRTSRRLDDDVRYMSFSCAAPVDSRSSKMLN
jgi:hypothetical protein